MNLRATILLPMLAVTAAHGAESAEPSAADLTKLSLEQLLDVRVYTASRFSQKGSDAPSSVSLITAADIKTYGYRTLADILRGVRGMYVTYDRIYSYIGVRGFARPGDYNSRVLVMVDGYRVNDPVYDTGYIGSEFVLDVDMIDRVEIVRGPSSSVYGSNAFFGVVNVITKSAADLKGAEISAEAASQGTWKARASFGRRFENGLEAVVSATGFDSRGPSLFFPEFDDPATNNGITRGTDYDRHSSVFTKLSYAGFTLEAGHSSRNKGVPTGYTGTVFNDARNRIVDTQTFASLGYYRTMESGTELSGRLYYGRYEYAGDYLYDYPPVTLNKDQALGEWWGAEVKLVKTVFKNHKLVMGGDFQQNWHQDQTNFDQAPFASYLDDRRSSRRTGLYLQDEYAVRDDWLLNAGLRYDTYSTIGGSFHPRLAAIHRMSESTVVKLLYGTAFRAPNAYESFYAFPGQQTGNPGLKPEKIKTWEAVLERYLPGNWRVIAAGYYYKVDGLITQVPIDDPATGGVLLQYQNLGNVDAKGVEFEAEHSAASGARLRASFTAQTARDDTGARLSNSPKHLAKLNYSVPVFRDKLRAGLELQYTGRRITTFGETGGFLVTNLTLFGEKLKPGLELSASIYNLFDRKYADPVAFDVGAPARDVIRQDGRTFRFKLTYRF
ncbi:MAG: TonB-dependent receptor [Burkholderiales bacterium]|nr:TonB-dependent receptor [Burkholderiales bacterium]